jgi:ferric-dicitrate binding protein FerR (iron transport regulator)
MTHRDRPPNEIPAEWWEWVDALCSGTITPAARDRLEALLRENEAARRFYLNYLDLHGQLHEALRGLPEFSPKPAGPRRRPVLRSFLIRGRWLHLTAVAALLLVALLVFWQWKAVPPPLPALNPVATVIESLAAYWGPEGRPLQPGEPLAAGPLELMQGVTRLRFRDGVEVVVEGPASLRLVGPRQMFLGSGRAVAHVPKQSDGFIIETPQAQLTDLGTEFGVGVGSSGDTEVHVFEGTVIANFKQADGQMTARKRLVAGEAWEMDSRPGAQPKPLDYAPKSFLHALPPRQPGDQSPSGILYNQPHFDTIHVVPAPADVRIDGDLSDWDQSGAFHSACRKPYDKHYYVAGLMMYDAQRLYIGAHVGDPAPLRNAIDQLADPRNTWRGGSVVVRLSTSKALGWPLEGQSPGLGERGKGFRPQDVSDNIVHLTLRYDQPFQRARLQVRYGMDGHGILLDPPGWEGAFQVDVDGQGYTLEYAIPWSLLHADRQPPAAGDLLAATWSIHWSDWEGRLCLGHLTDLTNPAYRPYTRSHFQYAGSWGKAIYHARGNLPPETVRGQQSR